MRSWTCLCLVALLAGACGCAAEKKCEVRGAVTRGGEKLTWPDGGMLLVIFIPEDRVRDTNVYSAQTDTATSTYTIGAIPPGRYSVAVQQFNTMFADAMNHVYDPSRTTLVVEVPAGGGVLDIDVPRTVEPRPRRGKGEVPPPPG